MFELIVLFLLLMLHLGQLLEYVLHLLLGRVVLLVVQLVQLLLFLFTHYNLTL
jgi:hypothetical protein